MRHTFEIENVKISWIGHATFLIEAENKKIYIDPYVIKEGLPKADYVFITHEHFDHCSIDGLKKVLKESTLVIIPKSCESKVEKVTKNYIVVSPGDIKEIDNIKFEVVHAYNIDKPFHKKGVGVGYVIQINNVRIYHAGDTDRIPEMKDLKDITVALLPIGGTYTMNVSEAIEAVKDIKPKYFIPMHYNYLPELNVADEELEKIKKELEGICNVVILKPP